MALGGTAPCPLCWDTALLAALGVLRWWCPPRLVALPAVLCVWEAQLCCPRTGHSSRSSAPRQGRQRRRSSALCLDVPDAGSSAFGVTAPQPRGFERIAQCPPICPPLLPCEGSLTSLVTCLRQTERRPRVSCTWKPCSIVHGTWMSLPRVISISSPPPAVLCVGMTSWSEVGTLPVANCFAPWYGLSCRQPIPKSPSCPPGNHAGCPDLGREFSAYPHISGAGVTPKAQLACNQLEVPQRCFWSTMQPRLPLPPSLEQLRHPVPCLHALLTHTPQPCIELVPKAAWCSM